MELCAFELWFWQFYKPEKARIQKVCYNRNKLVISMKKEILCVFFVVFFVIEALACANVCVCEREREESIR